VAAHHPEVVRKLVVVAAGYNNDGFQPGHVDMMKMLKGEMFAGSPIHADYLKLAPNPDNFAVMVEKVGQITASKALTREDIQGIAAPVQLIFGDSDVITLEHAVEMFRLLGGGVNGAMAGLPKSQLAILPATHHIGLIGRIEWLTSMITEFLDAPMP
jgi:pimeloyl-ACP methyl ester carboxylesterase